MSGKPGLRGQSKAHCLSSLECQQLYKSAKSVKAKTLLMLAISTGIRREDLVNLLWSNISLDTGRIIYTEKKKHGLVRDTYIGHKMASQLIEYKYTCKKNTDYVFDFCGRTAYNILQETCDVAGLRRRPFHALRSTCINLCICNGWDLDNIVSLTGDTARTLHDHYVEVSSKSLRESAVTGELV